MTLDLEGVYKSYSIIKDNSFEDYRYSHSVKK